LSINIEEAKEIIQQLRRGKGNNEMAWGASVVASSRLLQIIQVERFLNVHLVSKRQLFYCSGLYGGLGFNVGCFSVLHPGKL
jgi:hypothetical protein